MATYLSPVGSNVAPAANELRVLAIYKESLCDSYCANNLPQVTIDYTNGTPTLQGLTVFVPITAKISVVTASKCGCAKTTLRTETYMVAFEGYTSLPSGITISNQGRMIQASQVCCNNRTNKVTIYDALNIVLTPATA